jgi:hypothetical protein
MLDLSRIDRHTVERKTTELATLFVLGIKDIALYMYSIVQYIGLFEAVQFSAV